MLLTPESLRDRLLQHLHRSKEDVIHRLSTYTESPEPVSYALELKAEYMTETKDVDGAKALYEQLKSVDTMRAAYWQYRSARVA